MATLSSCRPAVLRAPAVVGGDTIAHRSYAPERRNPGQSESEARSGTLQTAINLAIGLLTIVGVGAFYGLLMLGMGQIASAAHLSPYAVFYAAGQNPWAQIETSPAPGGVSGTSWAGQPR